MTDQERIDRLERLLGDYVLRYGATPAAAEYFADMSSFVSRTERPSPSGDDSDPDT